MSNKSNFIIENGLTVNTTPVINANGVWIGPSSGLIGATGAQGINGATGAQGSSGSAGLTGATGPQGTNGSNGLTGATGVQGASGVGATGYTGATGVQGASGSAGLTGATGSSPSITNDTATNTTYYPAMYPVTSGTTSVSYTSDSKLYFNPSTGTLNSTIYNSLSDKKKKKNIKKIKNALDTVNQLNGVEFQWKENGAKSYGIIAQELEQILPDLVNTDNNGNKSVNYNGLFGFLINAIKEQQKQIDDLKKNK